MFHSKKKCYNIDMVLSTKEIETNIYKHEKVKGHKIAEVFEL